MEIPFVVKLGYVEHHLERSKATLRRLRTGSLVYCGCSTRQQFAVRSLLRGNPSSAAPFGPPWRDFNQWYLRAIWYQRAILLPFPTIVSPPLIVHAALTNHSSWRQ